MPDFDHHHYVPILKTKKGERWALSKFPNRLSGTITPLLEFHPHKTKPISDLVSETCKALESVWGKRSELFLDTVWINREVDNPTILKSSFDSARKHLDAVPVVRLPHQNDLSLQEFRSIAEQDKRGYMLRLHVSELNHPQKIENLLAGLRTTPASCHLLIDYKGQQMNLGFDVPRIFYLQDWRTLTSASGVFPSSLRDYPLNEWHTIQRLDWTSWIAGVTNGSLTRYPAFADYSTRDPGRPVRRRTTKS